MSETTTRSTSSTSPASIVSGTAGHPPDPKRWLALLVILIAQLMVVLDGTIVNIAMPSAQVALGIDDANRQWIVTAYTLTFGGLLLLGGRIADYAGRKRMFIIGLAGFALASALGGAAQNSAMLFAARGLQGAFGALLAPAALSLITVTFTDVKDRAKAFGAFGAISGVGAAIGLITGGLLTEYANWRWCLLVNIPIAFAAILAAIPIVRESKAQGNTRYDIPGALLATGGLATLVYGFTKAASDGWGSAVTLSFFAIAVVLLVGFVVVELRSKNPLLPMRVVLHRNRGGSYLTSVTLGAGMMGMFLFMTYYFQLTLHYSPLKTGIAYLPFSAALIITAIIGSSLLPRLGPRVMMTVGGLFATAAMVWLTQLSADSSYPAMILPALCIMAIGMGLVFVPLGNTALTGVANHDAGVASAMVNTSQQIGGSLGVALLNTVFTTAVANYVTSHARTTPPQELGGLAAIHGYNVAFTISAILFAVSTLIIFTMIRKDPRIDIESEARPAVHIG
ncbi:MFS transporter [Hamadaea tsunoensis]|uniref:MFS transporter n=1 Tax=Hamadaea tsunoensis TaxID=53368 RepID=UPI0004189A50|nr:MFS transporter [Hamadaea tsunoensis]